MLKQVMLLTVALLANPAAAVDVKISEEKDFIEVIHMGKLVRIQRIQDQSHILEGSFAKTSRKCPPFCIQPMDAAPEVKTIGQLELMEFLETKLLDETGIVIDARTPAWYELGTIPGSTNIPFRVFSKEAGDPELQAAMQQLGVKKRSGSGGLTRTIEKLGFMGGDLKNDQWDFNNARDLVLWCNGLWCGQSPLAIEGLLKHGYPASKLFYYRGGMQAWQSLGLTVIEP